MAKSPETIHVITGTTRLISLPVTLRKMNRASNALSTMGMQVISCARVSPIVRTNRPLTSAPIKGKKTQATIISFSDNI